MESRKDYFKPVDGVRYHLEDFQYELPEELIAQYPLEDRDMCRMLVVERETGKLYHRKFRDVLE